MALSNPAPIVVFDLDGTLIDTAPDLIGTLNLVFAEEGLPAIALDQARSLVGAGVRPLIERALVQQDRNLPTEEVDAMFARYIRHYQDHIADQSRPYPGLEDCLDRLVEDGFRLAVCTNKYEALSLRLLDALGLTQRFAAICGQDTFPDEEAGSRNAASDDRACRRRFCTRGDGRRFRDRCAAGPRGFDSGDRGRFRLYAGFRWRSWRRIG